MNNLVEYLDNYVTPTLDLINTLLSQGLIEEMQAEAITSSLLDTADEFDEESNDTIATMLRTYIN